MIDKKYRTQKQKLFEESANRTPHYGIRKYAVGAASVLLSTTLWMGANAGAVHADTVDGSATTEQVNTADQSSATESTASATTGAETQKQALASATTSTAAPAANSAETASASQAATAESQKSNEAAANEAPKADNSASVQSSAETATQKQADAQASVQKSTATSAETAKQAPTAASQTVNTSSVNTAASAPTAKQLASSKVAVRRNAVMLATTPAKQANAVTYSDRKTGKNLLVYQLGSSSYTTADQIRKYQNLGYKLVEDSTNGAAVSATGQAYSVVFDHDYMPASPQNPGKPGQAINVDASGAKYPEGTDAASLQHDVKRTVTYVINGGGDQAPAAKVDTLHFNALKMIDKVTGEVVSTKWDQDQDFADAYTPALAGYTPDKYFVSNKGIHATQADINEVVTYNADKQGVNVIYYDSTTGKVIKTDNLQGGTHTKSGYNTAEKVKVYTNNGYTLVSDTAGGKEIVFDNDNNTTQNYTITLAHTYLTVSVQDPGFPGSPMNQDANGTKYPEGTDVKGLTNTVTRTANYVVENGKKAAPAAVKDSLSYTATKTIDRVTGQVTETVWSGNQDFNDVATPFLKGYTADKTVVSDKNIAHDHPAIVETVTYKADAQKATVAFTDKTTGKTLAIKTLNGKTLENSGYTTAKDIQGYKDLGYALVSDSTAGKEIVYDDDDAATQEYTVVFEHTYATVDENNPGKPGENINAGQGSAKWPSGTDKASLGKDVVRTITYKTTDGSKAPEGTSQTLHFAAKKVVDKVTGSVISTTWSGAQDFKDVASPALKGYTADQKVISDKGITHEHSNLAIVVTYTPDAQRAAVTYVDSTTGNILAVKDLTGVTNAKSGYTTAGSIAGYQALGYTLVSDDTKGAEIVYDNEDAQDQKFTVTFKHGTTSVTAQNPGKPGQPINKDANGAKWPDGTDAKSLTDTVNRTITYVVKGGMDKAPSQVKDTLTYNATKVVDNVTGAVLSTAWSGAQDFKDVATPALTGYTADKASVSNKGVAHDASDIAEVVTYAPDAQKASVSFVDKATGKTLKVENLNGVTHANSGYTTAKDIQGYKDLGYTLVSDTSDGKEIVYDNDDAKDQAFTVTFTHGSSKVTIDNPGKPGQPINPGKGSANWPEGTDKAGLTKTVSRTISYKVAGDKDAAPEGKSQTLTFTAEKTVDNVTGQVTETKWSANQDFDDVETPALTGYTADKKVVSDKNIAHDHENIATVVTYNPDAQKGTVTYVDSTTGKSLKTDALSGFTHGDSGYKTADVIKSYTDKGYTLVSDTTNGTEVVFDNDDSKDQGYTVTFKHGTTSVTAQNPGKPGQPINKDANGAKWPDGTDAKSLTDTVNRTITYVVKGGMDKAPSQVKDTLTYNATKVVDNVTGAVLSTAWSGAQDFKDVATPALTGYTADKASVSNKGVAHDASDIAEVVTYAPDAQKASVSFVDKATGKTLKVENLNGVTHANSGYTTAKDIQGYKDLGYTLVSDTSDGKEIVYDNDDAKDQAFTVTFTHGSSKVTIDNPGKPGQPINPGKGSANWPEGTDKAGLTKTVSRTISYKVAGDKDAAPEGKSQTLTFTAEKTVDNVTGQVTETKWSANQDFDDVETPALTGYTADKKVVSDKNIAHDHENIATVVTYNPDAQKGTVTYVDSTTGKSLKTDALSGFTHGDSGYKTADVIKSYTDKGYTLVSDTTNGTEVVFDNDDSKDQGYTVTFKHGSVTVTADNPGKPGEEITPGSGVKYPEGTDKAGLTKTVSRTITYKMEDGSKAPDPVTQTLTFTATKTIDTVTGEVTETKWSGNQDFPDVTSPTVAGYTPDTATASAKGVAYDAGKVDTTITYKADAQKATVKYVDSDGTVIETKELTGVSNGHSGYSTISKIKELENKGYVLVSDDTTGSEIVFDTDDAKDQAYTVSFKHGTTTVTADNPKNPVTGQDDSANLIKKVHQTIKYVKVNGKRAAKSNIQTLTFKRNETIDAVTGKVLSYSAWDEPKSTKTVTSPKVAGYTASKKTVGAKSYTAQDSDKVITVTYSHLDKAVKKSKKSHKKSSGKMINGGSGTKKNLGGGANSAGKSGAGNGASAKSSTKKTQAASLTVSKASAAATSASQKKLPQTGESNDKAALAGLGLASILGGIGILGASKRKKKEN